MFTWMSFPFDREEQLDSVIDFPDLLPEYRFGQIRR
jgi:hypothetical protein